MLSSLEGRLAVVTGAASGIGRAMAERFAAEGMRLALADIDETRLAEVVEALGRRAPELLYEALDVSDEGAVNGFAGRVMGALGVPHLLCNNAGVGGGWSPTWAATRKDWDWMLGVNLYGVVHGVRAFLPPMLDGLDEGHIVNTSSVAAFMTGPGQVYGVTKYALQRYTEGLWYDLQERDARVGVSSLCPGIVATRINTAARNRPSDLIEEGRSPLEHMDFFEQMDRHYAEIGMKPEAVVEMVVDAVREGRFYILTHPEVKAKVLQRAEAIVAGSSPPAQAGTRAQFTPAENPPHTETACQGERIDR